MAAAGVTGLYVTHLNSLYKRFGEINGKGYPTKLGSLVSVPDEVTGQSTYRMTERPPLPQSMAAAVYMKYGAKLEEVVKRFA